MPFPGRKPQQQGAKIEKTIKAIFQAKSRVPALEELTASLLEQWGGADNFAKDYYTAYTTTNSAMVKARMLECLMRLVQGVNSRRVEAKLDDVSNSDLEQLAQRMLNAVAETTEREVEGAGTSEAGPGGDTVPPVVEPERASEPAVESVDQSILHQHDLN